MTFSLLTVLTFGIDTPRGLSYSSPAILRELENGCKMAKMQKQKQSISGNLGLLSSNSGSKNNDAVECQRVLALFTLFVSISCKQHHTLDCTNQYYQPCQQRQ